MATHSSILAWGIPWTEEPGGLQSRGRKETTEHAHTHNRLNPAVTAQMKFSSGSSSSQEQNKEMGNKQSRGQGEMRARRSRCFVQVVGRPAYREIPGRHWM